MRFGINLRGDLAKLDLSEIEERIELLFEEREAIAASVKSGSGWDPLLHRSSWTIPAGRGPFHARPFYWLMALYAFGPFEKRLGRLHLIECELKDLVDELGRRSRNSERSDFR